MHLVAGVRFSRATSSPVVATVEAHGGMEVQRQAVARRTALDSYAAGSVRARTISFCCFESLRFSDICYYSITQHNQNIPLVGKCAIILYTTEGKEAVIYHCKNSL